MSNQAPAPSLGFLLHEITRLMRRNFGRRVTLTQAQWRTLAYLSRNEGINHCGLADLLEVRPITLTRLIDSLEQAGWVRRQPDPRDRRACCLYLTPEAGPLVKQLQKSGAETTEQALAGMGAAERERLMQTLSTVKRNLLEAEASLAKQETQD